MECPAWAKPGSTHYLSELNKNEKNDLIPMHTRKVLFAKGSFPNFYNAEYLRQLLKPAKSHFLIKCALKDKVCA